METSPCDNLFNDLKEKTDLILQFISVYNNETHTVTAKNWHDIPLLISHYKKTNDIFFLNLKKISVFEKNGYPKYFNTMAMITRNNDVIGITKNELIQSYKARSNSLPPGSEFVSFNNFLNKIGIETLYPFKA